MMSIKIETYLRSVSGEFTRVANVADYDGDERHVAGAIDLIVDDQHVLDLDLWDDVDWMWPYVIQAIDEAVMYGEGERHLPGQPILFRVEKVGRTRLLIRVTGRQIHRVVSVDRRALLLAVALAALDFFTQLDRLIPGYRATVSREFERIEDWATTTED